jgi:hypothetical protein
MDTFEAQLARMLEDQRAVAFQMLNVTNPGTVGARQ